MSHQEELRGMAAQLQAGALVRLRTTSSNMTLSYVTGQEVLE